MEPGHSSAPPLVVIIPHRLGKSEALRRLKAGLDSTRPSLSRLLTVQEEAWIGDQLRFRVAALGQVASGTIDVADDHVRLEVMLPWLLALLVEKIRPAVQERGTLMLEKK
jgi:Putative polyhydroxyalkanoic acid system protein (PHA_gran_rgn)